MRSAEGAEAARNGLRGLGNGDVAKESMAVSGAPSGGAAIGAGSPMAPLTKTDAAYLALREAIVQGKYVPGERLTVSKLEDELRLSPTPIREALRLLQAHGYVEHESHRGVRVVSYSSADVEEVYRLRLALEPLACGLVAETITPSGLDKLWQTHNDLIAIIRKGQLVRGPQVNAQWHSSLYALANQQLLQDFIGRLWMSIPLQAIWNWEHSQKSVAEHKAIMEALAAHEAPLASDLMRQHIETNRPRSNPIFGGLDAPSPSL